MSNNASLFFNSLDINNGSTYNTKERRHYVFLNGDTEFPTTLQFISPTRDEYKPRFYAKCVVREEYSNSLVNITYDPTDITNPIVQVLLKFKKIKKLLNTKKIDDKKLALEIEAAKDFNSSYSNLITLVLGDSSLNEKGLKNTGLSGTTYFVANVAEFDNMGNPIDSGVLCRSSKKVTKGNADFTIYNYGISWYALQQSCKNRGIDLADIYKLYNYVFTFKANKPNPNDPNWFSNNSLLDIIGLTPSQDVSKFTEYDIGKTIKYTPYATIGSKIGYIFREIDSHLGTSYNEILRQKGIQERTQEEEVKQVQIENIQQIVHNNQNPNINMQQQMTQSQFQQTPTQNQNMNNSFYTDTTNSNVNNNSNVSAYNSNMTNNYTQSQYPNNPNSIPNPNNIPLDTTPQNNMVNTIPNIPNQFSNISQMKSVNTEVNQANPNENSINNDTTTFEDLFN